MRPGDKTYRNWSGRICELVDTEGRLDGFTFEDSSILGPAILILEDSSLINNTLEGPSASALLWEVDIAERPVVVGAILAKNCSFERCRFTNIGFAGPPEAMAQIAGQG